MILPPSVLALSLATALLARCAGAPPPLPAAPTPPAAWSVDDPAIALGEMRLDWWSAFGSAELD